MMGRNGRNGAYVLGAFIDATSWDDTLDRIANWAAARESRYVCICNVHSIVTAMQNNELQRVINEADMATPDGMPVAWMLRSLGSAHQQRINGPDLMWKYCERAARRGEGIYLFGSTEATLTCLVASLRTVFPRLNIMGIYSPPFRELSVEEDRKIVNVINDSHAGVVFVGLGCPKQEKWMATHRGRIRAVMIGVGAAFDYHARTVKRAPLWMQHSGLEWLHRLCSEPRRLWKRYLMTNILFILGATRQLVCRYWKER